MKKDCPVCKKSFFGRSDKLFCSTECKNNFHNSQRRNGIVNATNHLLYQNRLILQQLVHGQSEKEILERVVLERLGFKFDLFTGVIPSNSYPLVKKVYEFTLVEMPNGNVIVERQFEQDVF